MKEIEEICTHYNAMNGYFFPKNVQTLVVPAEDLISDKIQNVPMRVLCRQISNVSQDSFDLLYYELPITELYNRMIEISAINAVSQQDMKK